MGCAVPTRVKPSLESVVSVTVPIVIEKDGDEYHAYSPALRGLHIDGPTVDEAFLRAQAAAATYIDTLRSHNLPLPAMPTALDIPESAVIRTVALEWPLTPTSGNS